MSRDYSENTFVQETVKILLHNAFGMEKVFACNKEVLYEDGTFGKKSYR